MILLLLSVATAAPQPAPAEKLVMGPGRSCVILEDGTTWCWGYFDDKAHATPARLPVEDVANLTIGIRHTCALNGAGEVWCWGEHPGLSATPSKVTGLGRVVDLDGFGDLSCALSEEGAITCWGGDSGENRECGVWANTPPSWSMESWLELEVPGARDLAVGQDFVCALDAQGALVCSDTPHRNPDAPAREDLGPFEEIDAGSLTLTGRLADGRVLWWQSWTNMTLRVGVPVVPMSPVGEVLPRGASPTTGGDCHGCALVDGQVACWGENRMEQVGRRGPSFIPEPYVVVGLPPIQDVAAGFGESCAVDEEGAVWCWGRRRSWIPQRLWDPPLGNPRAPLGLWRYARQQTLQVGERVARDEQGEPMVVPALVCPVGSEAHHGRPAWAAALWRWAPRHTEAAWCEAEGVRDGPFVARGRRVETMEGSYSQGARTGPWLQWMNEASKPTVSRAYVDDVLDGVCQINYPGTTEHRVFGPKIRHTATASGGQLHGAWSLSMSGFSVAGWFEAGEPVGIWHLNGQIAEPVTEGEIAVTARDAEALLVLATNGTETWMATGPQPLLPTGVWRVVAVDVETNEAFMGKASPTAVSVEEPVPYQESCRLVPPP
ncbi:MAG: hypothetical protein H6739_03575 [Alphaproteobacteria bacterium]|nr:hypothetical protein [Alphaproteobacteria bacterium]